MWVTVSVLLGGLAASAGAAAAAGGLVAHRAYECVTAPNYWGWKGPVHGDRGQLTDGGILPSWSNADGKEFYSLPSAAGWTATDPVVLLFDLGAVRSIGGLGLHSVLSPWGPWWPDAVAVLVSDDGKSFYAAGPPLKPAAAQLAPPLTKEVVQAAVDRVLPEKGLAPSTHWWRTHNLQARGRYVTLILTTPATTGTIVLDEVEIYPGKPELLQASRPARVFREGRGGWQSYLLARALDGRLSRDASKLARKVARASLAPATRRQLHDRLLRLQRRCTETPVPPIDGFRAVLPVSSLHRQVFRVQAALWRAKGAPHLRVWQGHRWDPLGPLDEPRPGKPRVRIVMAANEVRSDVLNLTNASQEDAVVRLTFRGLPAASLDVFEVLTVDTKGLAPVTAAMVPAVSDTGAYRIRVPAGMTRQVWLRCSSKRLQPRSYVGAIHLAASRGETLTVPARVEVLPVRLPDRFTLSVGGWDYAIDQSYQATPKNRDPLVALLRAYGINVAWATDSAMPHGTYDGEGNLAGRPSRERMDQWLALWPGASRYCVVSHAAGVPQDAPQRAERIAAWARDWADYLRARGISPERLAVLLCDEPTSESELRVILESARAIKQGAPEVEIWNDIHFADPGSAPSVLDEVMREACDIQCINRQHYQANPEANDAFMSRYRRSDLEWWTYSAGAMSRSTDPYVGWLLQEWFCFDKGLTGTHFWAFGNSGGGFSWNEYLNPGSACTPLYLSPDAVTTSKYMEALREGLQDYEVLRMLKQALDRGADSSPAAVTGARQVLLEGVRRILAVDNRNLWAWSVPKDRSAADRVREDALRALQSLGASGP